MTHTVKRITFTLFFCVLLGLFSELLCYVLLSVAQDHFDEPIRTTRDIYEEQSAMIRSMLGAKGSQRDLFDSELGWRYRAGFSSSDDHLSAQGLRGNREYALERQPGSLRVAAFGDSFVYGTEVRFEDAWPRLIEDLYPAIEVPNYGVGGYGTDQALLRYRREGRTLAPDCVLIGFAPINIVRNVNRYRRFFSTMEWIWAKPRFLISDDGRLDYLASPIHEIEDWNYYLDNPADIRSFGDRDLLYEPLIYDNPFYDWSASVRLGTACMVRIKNRYMDPQRVVAGGTFNPRSPAFSLQQALFAAFAAEVRASGSTPIVLILPSKADVRSIRSGEPALYSTLIEVVENLTVWDLGDAFRTASPPKEDLENWFMSGGHYSQAGNRMVAEWIGKRLEAEVGLRPPRRTSLDPVIAGYMQPRQEASE